MNVTKRQAAMLLESIEKRAIAETEQLAKKVREGIVLPVCRGKGLEFTSGMGRWSFSFPGNPLYQRYIEPEEAEKHGMKRVFEILSLPTLWASQDLGDWVESVTESDLKGERQ